MNIDQYIKSGIIETYVMGLATPEEASQLERLLPFYAELQAAISDFSFQVELFAIQHEEPPPPGVFEKIQDRVRELPEVRKPPPPGSNGRAAKREDDYLYVKENSTHIRVHKYWRIAFICIFILSKILLIGFLYFFLAYRHSERDLQSLKDEQVKPNKAQLFSEPQDGDK